jgi:hypothetical protein
MCKKHGKPVFLLLQRQVSRPQGKPNGMRAEECGKSECHSVVGWIEVETSPHTKVGRLLHGDFLQETFRTYLKKKSK